MRRWVVFIQLFSFNLIHRPGQALNMPGGLSGRPLHDDSDDEAERFVEDIMFINAKGSLRN